MNLQQDCDSDKDLCCDQCHFQKFPSKLEFKLHYSAHKREPVVSLFRLSDLSVKKLKHQSYKVNNGVARRTRNLVSPLRISLRKQEGSIEFQVVKVPRNDRRSDHGHHGESNRSTGSFEADTGLGVTSDTATGKKEIDGNKSQEHYSSNISVTRTSNTHLVHQYQEEKSKELEDNGNLIKNNLCGSGQEQIVGNLINGGVSVIKQNPSVFQSFLSNEHLNLPNVSVVSAGTEDANQLKRCSAFKAVQPNKQKLNKTKILKKLNGLGFSLIPTTADGTNTEEQSRVNDSAGKEHKRQRVSPLKIINCGALVRSKNCSDNAINNEYSKNLSSNSLCITDASNESTSVENWSLEKVVANDTEEPIVSKDNCTPGLKKHFRVQNSVSNGHNIQTDEKEGSNEVDPKEFIDSDNYVIKSACEGVDNRTAKRRRRSSKSSKTPKSSGKVAKGRKSATKMGVESPPIEQLQPDFIAPRLEHVTSPLTRSESQCKTLEEQNNRLEESNDCSMVLGSVQDGEDGESSNFNSVNCSDGFRSEPFAEENNDAELLRNEVAVSFSSIPSDGSSLDEPQQDPLNSGETSSSSGDTMSHSFLHNFLNESQTSQMNIQPESSDYMTLERLAHGLEGQHGHAGFDVNTGEPPTPMEQLSQQVQRLPNPQINPSILSHHHIPAPQPPQLRPGLPTIGPQQTSSFDPLGHIQAPLPPPLFQGFGMFNQNFPPQGPQQLQPRPPMLQQRPPIQARGFPNLASLPRPRSRYSSKRESSKRESSKRGSTRLPSPQEAPQKQRRVDQVLPARSQASVSPTPKVPAGITVTPAKKKLDANKVANVLASRGITVTQTAGIPRQSSPSNRSHQRGNPMLSTGQGVSTPFSPNGNNRSGTNFAVPPPRQNNPVVNPDVERPERCTTVDLTLDDEPIPSSQVDSVNGNRFSCSQCSKVYPTMTALEHHKASHRVAGALPYKCEKCAATYPNAAGLQQHRAMFHKKSPTPDLAIPIIDLNHPGVREQLAKCGVNGFLPLSQLQSNNLGYFGLPIIQLDSTKEKAVPNMNLFGASNVLLLGKMKLLSQPQVR